MSTGSDSFSRRHGYSPRAPEIKIRKAAPDDFRFMLLQNADQKAGLTPKRMRPIVCGVLRVRPNPNNWSEYPNIQQEVANLVYDCKWHQVYDILEAIWDFLNRRNPFRVEGFETAINECFIEMGIGWKLVDGKVEARGDDAQETILRRASEALEVASMPTAQGELREALTDLSRRPEPDLSGAVHHAMAALECVARRVCGDSKRPLGELLKRYKDLFPKPLDDAISKVWGYSSEVARHAREDRVLEREEAELIVGLAASLCTYLAQKLGGQGRQEPPPRPCAD